jgi:HD-GYP domain-containing protein (c-di-GMP phosphodiesterase class II)
MTQGVPFLERVSGIIRNHHERWDGSGYPDGLRADAIPIGARIVAVADTWDAVTSDRPYQQGRSPAEALVILQRLSGTTLDTDVVRALELSLAELGVLTNDTTATPAASPAEDPRGDDRPARSRTN